VKYTPPEINMDRRPVYKAIKRKTRTSAMLHGNSKYAKKYMPGEVVMANEGTLGIFVFKYKTYAEDWVNIWNGYHSYESSKDLIYVPVIPIGRGRKLIWIAGGLDRCDLDRYYSEDTDHYGCRMGEAPDNTMGYPGVYVLE
jgi:hypothetical protein